MARAKEPPDIAKMDSADTKRYIAGLEKELVALKFT